ncbi:hypothetical protein KKB83_03415 [Patescibacteria group bacterium]|nr:hypothetical protein [Patescibacteria group bacterium]
MESTKANILLMGSGTSENNSCDPEVDENTEDMEQDEDKTGDHQHDDDG